MNPILGNFIKRIRMKKYTFGTPSIDPESNPWESHAHFSGKSWTIGKNLADAY